MDQFVQILVPIAVLIFGLLFFIRMIIPRSTLIAIQNAIWHRVICGSSNNALSFSKLIKFLLIGFGLLYILSKC
ncbi:MAG: hypothetical protein C4530_00205 [Desulfobacteraceae bacterium]|nr:MAG: hypothetical protein C4530_00205 [Desulfobacteraceae bacterium]